MVLAAVTTAGPALALPNAAGRAFNGRVHAASATRDVPVNGTSTSSSSSTTTTGAGAAGIIAKRKVGVTNSTSSSTSTTAPSAPGPAPNLLTGTKASFDGGVGGWTSAHGTLQWIDDPVYAGTGALAITTTTYGRFLNAASGSNVTSLTPIEGGRVYRAALMARAESTARMVSVSIGFWDRLGQFVTSVNGMRVSDSNAAWASLAAVGIAPPSAAYASVGITIEQPAVNEIHVVDAAGLFLAPGPQPVVHGPLHTAGNTIVDAAGQPLRLRGVNRHVGVWKTDPHLITEAEIAALRGWGANMIRFPLADAAWMPGCDQDPGLPGKVDDVVRWITSRGMVALVELAYANVGGCGAPYKLHDMADEGAVAFWADVAARYRGNPLVAFDLFNEPHDVGDDVWLHGGSVTEGVTTYTAAGMQEMYDAVRGAGASNLVFVSARNWAASALTQVVTGSDIVYGQHPYTCSTTAKCAPGEGYDSSSLLDRYVPSSAHVPIVLTEAGYPYIGDGNYNMNLIDGAEQRGYGWMIYAFTGSPTDTFSIVHDNGPYFEPAPGGMPVLLGLRQP